MRANRLLVTLVLTGSGLAATLALDASGTRSFAPMIGAVAISCWYGGVLPGLVSILVGWSVAWFAVVSSDLPWEVSARGELQWLVPLVVSLLIVWVSWALRRAGTRATVRAESAERERRTMESIQSLTSELSSALTPSDVAHALVARLPSLLGSAGAALGLVDGDVLQIVDPAGAPSQTIPPGTRLELAARAPITAAVRTNQVVVVSTRRQFEQEYPDGAKLAPYANGVLAAPLRAGGKVVGSMGFPFREVDAIDDEVISLVQLAADLGGQALERAELYEQEVHSHETLDRITRLAPLFGSESPESVVEMVCKEALRTFDAEVAHVWSIDGDLFDVVWREPPVPEFPPGTTVAAADYPGLAESLDRLEPMFIADSWTDVRGEALALAQTLGIRSSLRVPVAVDGRAAHVLVLQWTHVRPAPSSSTIVMARRFADQAGLALEHAQRRVAQAAASQSAEETRRLLDLTAALAAALEPADVADAALREAFRGLGAAAGSVARLAGEHELEVLSVVGYPGHVPGSLDRISLDEDIPLCDAVRRGEVVTLASPAERARRYPGVSAVLTSHAAWMTLPLVAGGRVIGGLGLAFDAPRSFTDADRAFALALSRQAGQALERSTLLETEQIARLRAERMASDLAQLHALATALGRAGDATEVMRIIGEQAVHGVGASSAGIYLLDAERTTLSLLSVSGDARLDELSGRGWPVDESNPLTDAVRLAHPVWLSTETEWSAYPSAAGWRTAGVSAVGIAPLVVEGMAIGALLVGFDDERAVSDEERRFVETVARQAAQPIERVRLLEEERIARDRSERLQELTAALSGALTTEEVVDVFLHQAARAVGARAAAIALVGRDGRVPDDADWLGDPAWSEEGWGDRLASYRAALRETAAGARPLYVERTAPPSDDAAEGDATEAHAFVPLLAGRKPCAMTVLAWDGAGPVEDDERAFVEAFASQCGQALDRAQRYETERTIAETLQRSVLPETLPSMEGATVAARYLPGTAAVDVGGDWFDTILLPDGRLAFVVGDVVGKGVEAASTMGQLRNGMRALTLDSSDPAVIVSNLNRLLDAHGDASFATLAFVAIEPTTGEATLVSAGHLPPLLLSPDREPRLLEGVRGIPLGVQPDTTYATEVTVLPPGSVLVLYTDGLVERRDRPLDEGLQLLVEAARGTELDAEQLVDALVERLLGDADLGDDVAVLVVKLDRVPLGTFSITLPADRSSLGELRRSFEHWLERGGIADVDRADLTLATWEASANAIEHAQDPAADVFEVEATLTGDRVRVAVLDSGSWKEPRSRPDRGLGLHLIQALTTSLSVEPGPGGTRVVMERALSRERAGESEEHAVGNGRS